MLENVEKVFYEIKDLILSSEKLRKLLVYTTPDALFRTAPTFEEADKHIKITPVVYLLEESEEKEVNHFISIGMIEAGIFDSLIIPMFKITIACDTRSWELDKNGIRPLQIVSEVLSLLYHTKLSTAGKSKPTVIKEVYYNNKIVGYTLVLELQEPIGSSIYEF